MDDQKDNQNDREVNNENNMNLSHGVDIIVNKEQSDIYATPIIIVFVRPIRMSKHSATLVVMNTLLVIIYKTLKGKWNKQ